MFTAADRERVRALLLERARADPRIAGAALTGSAADGREDRWSDIDLYFGLAAGAEVAPVLADWTEFAARELGAIHHFDLHAGGAVYRAFLLADCLEADLAFAPAAEFGARGPGFRVLFGEAVALPVARVDAGHVVGLAWHHALHARVAIERARPWLAEYWISALRDHAITLACIRLGLAAAHAKAADDLPGPLREALGEALVRGLERAQLERALRGAAAAFRAELALLDAPLAVALDGTFAQLTG